MINKLADFVFHLVFMRTSIRLAGGTSNGVSGWNFIIGFE